MLTLLCVITLGQLSPPGDQKVLEVARKHIDGVLKAPATAQYKVVTMAPDEKPRYWSVVGTLDAQNTFGASLRHRWIMQLDYSNFEIRPIFIYLMDGDRVITPVYESAEFAKIKEKALAEEKVEREKARAESQKARAEEAEKKEKTLAKEQAEREKARAESQKARAQEAAKRAKAELDRSRQTWKAYARMVSQIETKTNKLPYNHPKRSALYWRSLNMETERFLSRYRLTPSSLEDLVKSVLAENWPTDEPKDREAVQAMLRRYNRLQRAL
jgi:hypothetical protein